MSRNIPIFNSLDLHSRIIYNDEANILLSAAPSFRTYHLLATKTDHLYKYQLTH